MDYARKSVSLFFILVFILSVPFWALAEIHPVELLPGLPLSALGAFTPATAALILLYRKDRMQGVGNLLRRSWDFKRVKNKYWYFAFVLINPAIAVMAYQIIRHTKAVPKPASLTLSIIPLFLVFLVGALGEELGWTGFATELLCPEHGADLKTGSKRLFWETTGAGLMLGIVWAVFNFIPLLQAQRSMDWIAWWSLGTISLRIILTWLFVLSGRSVGAAALFHAMINLSWQLFPINGSFYDPRVFSLLALVLAMAIILLARRYSRIILDRAKATHPTS